MSVHIYKKRPVEISAIQFDGENQEAVVSFIRSVRKSANGIVIGNVEGSDDDIYLETLEGIFHVAPGDFIICGVQNEFYPCKPDIFAITYELVE